MAFVGNTSFKQGADQNSKKQKFQNNSGNVQLGRAMERYFRENEARQELARKSNTGNLANGTVNHVATNQFYRPSSSSLYSKTNSYHPQSNKSALYKYRRASSEPASQPAGNTKSQNAQNPDSGPSEKDRLLEDRMKLPIWNVRNSLKATLRKENTVILIGETACGKTTQIPQFLNDMSNMLQNGCVAISQPRRVAAISIATRVAAEMGTQLGKLVGYSVRFDQQVGPETRIKYITDGMLLREAIQDKLLSRYAVIILDEAHERRVDTDLLFGIVKGAQRIRTMKPGCKPLKIIVMSATMDVDHFSTYFSRAPVLYLEGRQFPIRMNYTKMPIEDRIHAAMVTVFQIHQYEQSGDILVFCTGQEEIESMVRTCRDTAKNLPTQLNGIKDGGQQPTSIMALPFYSALSPHAQQLVFRPLHASMRKVIFATNIAETSITIPNIRYVIDTGLVKVKRYHPATRLEYLKVEPITRAQASQRSGRAGREAEGVCYRLYTREQYKALEAFPVPDILRSSFTSVALVLLASGIHDLNKFEFLDKPQDEHLTQALQELELLGAIEKYTEQTQAGSSLQGGPSTTATNLRELFRLTALGKQMAYFPLDPRYARIILDSTRHGCTEEVLSIISLLSAEESIFQAGGVTSLDESRDRAGQVLAGFSSSEGDTLMMLKAYRAWTGIKSSPQEWAKEHFLNTRGLDAARKIRKQLADICKKSGVPLGGVAPTTECIRRCLTSGLFLNAAHLQLDGTYKTVASGEVVHIHPSSCLFRAKPECVLFSELVQTSKSYMRNLTLISKEWLPSLS